MENIKTVLTEQHWLADISHQLVEGVNYLETNYLNKVTQPCEAWLREKVGSVGFWSTIDNTLEENIHPLSKGMPYNNPVNVLFLVAGYFAMLIVARIIMDICFKEGIKPRLMQIVHNFICVAISLFMTVEVIRQAIMANYTLFGNEVGKGGPTLALGMRDVCYVFFMSKVYEFLDTLIMILRKNYRQVSFLHVYHHSSVFMLQWLVTYIAPGGDSYFSVLLNSFVHTVMYSYYLSNTLGYPLTFIKSYITIMQMSQFILLFTQAIYDFIYPPKDYPVILKYALATYMITMLFLFGHFFRKDLARRRKQKAEAQKKKQ